MPSRRRIPRVTGRGSQLAQPTIGARFVPPPPPPLRPVRPTDPRLSLTPAPRWAHLPRRRVCAQAFYAVLAQPLLIGL